MYCESDGTIYDGEWIQGQKYGIARVKYANDDTFIGDYRYGKKHVQGQYTLKTGEVYSGEFINDMKHGMGTLLKNGTIINAGLFLIELRRKMGRG